LGSELNSGARHRCQLLLSCWAFSLIFVLLSGEQGVECFFVFASVVSSGALKISLEISADRSF
jgi:hypothetical protein